MIKPISKNRELKSKVRAVSGQYSTSGHYFLSERLNSQGVRTLGGSRWTAESLNMFMRKNQMSHRTNDKFSATTVIAENRSESMLLLKQS